MDDLGHMEETEETFYFYSTDGSDALGPVTHEEFCQLIRDKVIGSESFFCYEGETEWRPLDPDVFVRPPGTTRLPPYEPPPYVPPPDARARDEERIEQLQSAYEDPGPFATTLACACWLLVIVATVILQKLLWGGDGFVGYIFASLVVGVLPYLISRLFPAAWRLRIWLLGIVVISSLAIVNYQKLADLTQPAAAPEPAPAPDASK
jgi:hypothetical protein